MDQITLGYQQKTAERKVIVILEYAERNVSSRKPEILISLCTTLLWNMMYYSNHSYQNEKKKKNSICMGKGKCYWDNQRNEGLNNVICKYKSELNRSEKGLFKLKQTNKHLWYLNSLSRDKPQL